MVIINLIFQNVRYKRAKWLHTYCGWYSAGSDVIISILVAGIKRFSTSAHWAASWVSAGCPTYGTCHSTWTTLMIISGLMKSISANRRRSASSELWPSSSLVQLQAFWWHVPWHTQSHTTGYVNQPGFSGFSIHYYHWLLPLVSYVYYCYITSFRFFYGFTLCPKKNQPSQEHARLF